MLPTGRSLNTTAPPPFSPLARHSPTRNGAARMSATTERIIRPSRGLIGLNLGELWRFRELLGQLAWRDVLIRYKQTYLGVAWAVLQPVLTVVVFTVLFGKMAKFDSWGAPYPILTLAALLPWQFFANALTESSG